MKTHILECSVSPLVCLSLLTVNPCLICCVKSVCVRACACVRGARQQAVPPLCPHHSSKKHSHGAHSAHAPMHPHKHTLTDACTRGTGQRPLCGWVDPRTHTGARMRDVAHAHMERRRCVAAPANTAQWVLPPFDRGRAQYSPTGAHVHSGAVGMGARMCMST